MTAAHQLFKELGLELANLDVKVGELVQWVESIRSYAFGIAPILGSRRTNNCLDIKPLPPTLTSIGIHTSLSSAFQELRHINEQLSLRAFSLGSFIWDNPVDIDQLIHPLTYQFLTLHYTTPTLSPLDSCIQNAALLYIAEFRRKLGISPVLTDIHTQRPRSSLETIDQKRTFSQTSSTSTGNYPVFFWISNKLSTMLEALLEADCLV
ncbi:hypothetical protein BJX70DRAFT_367022 [Aspergillus crustosus]